MYILQIFKKFNFIILFQLSIVISNEFKIFCDTGAYCDNCTFCEIKNKSNNNQCSFENLFCLQNKSNNLFFNSFILPQYYSFYKNNTDNLKIYDEKINLTILKNSFKLIKVTNKYNEDLNKTHFYYLISNYKYFKNKKDSAFLNIQYNAQNNKKNSKNKNNVINTKIIFRRNKRKNMENEENNSTTINKVNCFSVGDINEIKNMKNNNSQINKLTVSVNIQNNQKSEKDKSEGNEKVIEYSNRQKYTGNLSKKIIKVGKNQKIINSNSTIFPYKQKQWSKNRICKK